MKSWVEFFLVAALAMASERALALSLGAIQIQSGLDQPLVAEIPVFGGSQDELADLRIALAKPEDFTRLGLSRERVTLPIDFVIDRSPRGELTIRLTTKGVVREPLVDLLVEAEWSNGRLLREYPVMLDPPTALLPTASALTGNSKPLAAPAPTSATLPNPTVKASPLASALKEGEYFVRKGDTLSAIASRLPVAPGVSLGQTMQALFKANPTAFYRRDLDSLKAGVVLHIREGTDNLASASRNGPSSDTHGARQANAAAVSLAQARLKTPATMVAMSDRAREADELKQRIGQLEEIHDKNSQLIALLDSKIAALRRELQAAQTAQAAIPAPSPTEGFLADSLAARGAFKAAASDSTVRADVFRPKEAAVLRGSNP